jgi:DNA-binding LacI/PurR family transcriptional regulator
VTGIGEEAAQANYHFTLFTGQLDPRKLTQICRASIADGIILMQVKVDDWRVETLRKLHFPFVMIGRSEDNQDLNYIDLDFENAVIKAYEHLVNLGHKKIGFFTYPEAWRTAGLGPSIRSALGFQQAIKRYSLEPIYYEMNLNVDDSRSCVRDAIQQHPDMTAIMALHNSIAVGAINAVQSIGKRIPDDYSLLGVSLGAGSELIIPPLTAIHWEGYEVGRQAASMLIDILSNKISVPKQVLILPELVSQGSTAVYSLKE